MAGYSYGGFMACVLTSRTDRFAAAVAGGAVTDMISLAGTSDDGHGLAAVEFGGMRDHDPARYAEMSPITRVADVHTPTLLLHGTADERCPIGQAEQWFSALRERGVPTRLVQYPGGSHPFVLDGRPSHRLDYNQRIIDWVTAHTTTRRRPTPDRVDAFSESHWRVRLAELAARHGVPGAVLGIGHGDGIIEVACGVLNTATGVAATTDSLFQIGSITKVWTATLIMQLVDEGTLDLDAPVAHVLPELSLGSPGLTKRVTTRHLLTHTSGIDGDVFIDTGRGDDCVERYVATLAGVAENHPLGATMSYCNAGFVLAGRVVEQLTGTTWDAALRDRLIRPLGLSHTVTLPEDAIRFRAATGHVAVPGEPSRPAAQWQLPRSCGPAGLISSTARDVLAFARLHLSGGRTADGTQVVSAASVAAMRERRVDAPDPHTYGDAWGLGWALCSWGGHRLAGHDGGTVGQAAFVRMLPEHDLAVVLLTNGGHARGLYQDLYREIFRDLAGVAMPRPPEPPADVVALDVSRYAGSYERAGIRLEFTERDGRLVLTTTVTGELAHLLERQPEDTVLIPVRENLFVTRNPGDPTWTPVTFYQIADGSPYVHMGGRATPKRG